MKIFFILDFFAKNSKTTVRFFRPGRNIMILEDGFYKKSYGQFKNGGVDSLSGSSSAGCEW